MVDPAELFEAISHPERIKILKILRKQPSGFASLKRQLDIESSGNLDFHLKKLGQLVTVREDGLYGLTDAGKEAILSIEAIEMWTEMEKRKIKMPRMPKEAFFLGLLELCTTASVFWFFLAVVQVPLSMENLWGYIFLAALLLMGLCSGLGMFIHWKWSWTMVLAKSALIMSMSLFLLNYIWIQNIGQPVSVAIYLVFVAAETAAVIVALLHPLKDFLGIGNGVKLSLRAIIGSLLCISSGILLIILEIGFPFNTIPPQLLGNPNTVFISIFDPTILCGLIIVIGGVLILLRSNTLCAAMSIIFGLFPPLPYANHLYDIVAAEAPPNALAPLIAVVVGFLPIAGGLLALTSARKILT
jgi:DNA-binding HxlR family transcriptional regulator